MATHEVSSVPTTTQAADASPATTHSELPENAHESAHRTLGRVNLSKDNRSKLVTTLSDLRYQRDTGPKEGDSVAAVKIDHTAGEVLYPDGIWKDESNLLGIAIGAGALELGYDIWLYNQNARYQVREPTKEVRDFFTGFILGTSDKINLKLIRKTSNVELGRAVALAIRIRGYFRENDLLGSAALKKNQAFFGNDPKVDPRTKQVREHMVLDRMLEQYLSDPAKDLESMKKGLVQLLEACALDNINDVKVKAAIVADALVSIEDLLDGHRRIPKGDTKPKKKESKKALKGKLPEKPSSSPLLTRDELDEINSYLGPLWTVLSPVSQQWAKTVQDKGYKNVKVLIDSCLKTRWESLEALSSVTTRRLREVKLQQDDAKLTKRRISQSDFETWCARSRTDSRWLSELCSITKPLREVPASHIDLMEYPKRLWNKSKELKTRLDDLRFANQAKPGESEQLDTTNPMGPLSHDDQALQEFKRGLSTVRTENLHTLTQFEADEVRKDDYIFIRGNFTATLKAEPEIVPLFDLKSREEHAATLKVELKSTKHGPNSILAKTYKWLLEESPYPYVILKAKDIGLKTNALCFYYTDEEGDKVSLFKAV